jgi:hypothetical protein
MRLDRLLPKEVKELRPPASELIEENELVIEVTEDREEVIELRDEPRLVTLLIVDCIELIALLRLLRELSKLPPPGIRFFIMAAILVCADWRLIEALAV